MNWLERSKLLDEIVEYVYHNHIESLRELKIYAVKNRPDWFEAMRPRSARYMLHEFIASCRRCKWEPVRNPETGEIYE